MTDIHWEGHNVIAIVMCTVTTSVTKLIIKITFAWFDIEQTLIQPGLGLGLTAQAIVCYFMDYRFVELYHFKF